MKIVIIIFSGVLLFSSKFCFSQSNSTPVPQLDKSIIQPSPDAAAFAKYGSHPVTLYAGKTNTSIPIYDIKLAKINMSVALTYNYAGFRPAEVASSVGMGWDLNAGGVITRQIKDKPDDQADSLWHDNPNIELYTNNQKYKRDVAENTSIKIDLEPDLYHFNVGGYTGKFILIKNRAFLIPQQDIRIHLNPAGNFTMWAPDGTIYEFNDKESTQILAHTGGQALTYVSAWQLTRIKSSNQNETISFLYDTWSYQSAHNEISESYRVRLGIISLEICHGQNNSCDQWTKMPYNGTIIAAKRLKEITGSNCRIEFIKSANNREDLSTNSTSFTLNEIKIYEKNTNKIIKKVKFYYNYFEGVSTYNQNATKTKLKLTGIDIVGYHNIPANTNPDLKPEKYLFEYQNENIIDFPAFTRGIDRWGYYNGANGNFTLFNSEIILTSYSPAMGEANRNVNSDKVRNGILTKITYPTKGHTTFEYEINKVNPNLSGLPEYEDDIVNKLCVNDYAPPILVSCNDATGINIPSYNNNPQNVEIFIKRTFFSLNQSNQSNTVPLLEVFESTNMTTPYYVLPLFSTGQISMTVNISLPVGLYFFNIKTEANALSTLLRVKYKKIKPPVIIDGPGLRVKTISSYDNINNTIPTLVKNFEYPIAAKANMNHRGGKLDYATLWDECATCVTTGANPIIVPYVGSGVDYMYTTNVGTAMPPQLNEILFYPEVYEKNSTSNANGKTIYKYETPNFAATGPNLTEQLVYDANENLLAKTENSFSLFGGTKSYYAGWLYPAWYLQQITPLAGHEGCVQQDICNPFRSEIEIQSFVYKEYAITPYLITSYHNALINKKEYQKDGANELVTNTDYFYDNPNYTMPTKVLSKNSRGEEIITETKYPQDYTAVSDCGTDANEYTAFNASRTTITQQAYTNILNRFNQALLLRDPQIPNFQNTNLINFLNDPINNHEGNSRQLFKPVVNAHSLFPITSANCLVNKTMELPAPSYLNAFTTPLFLMQSKNIVNRPGEQMSYLKKPGGPEYLQNAVKYFYTTLNQNYLPDKIQSTPITPLSVTKADFLANRDNYYKDKIKFSYTELGQIKNQYVVNNIKTSYIYGYNNLYPIAEVVNAEIFHAAYTSFEEPLSAYSTWGIGKWLVTGGTLNTALRFIGKNSFVFNMYNSAPARIESDDIGTGTFTVSFWKYGTEAITVKNEAGIAATAIAGITKNGWTYYEYSLTNPSRVIVESSSATIDELRLHPSGAVMTNYCYEPLIGVTAKITPNNQLLKYVYDGFGRLTLIRDIDDNVVKKFCYNLAGQVEDCNTVSCEGADETPNWQNTTMPPTCQVNTYGVNTGVVLQQQEDINLCSTTEAPYRIRIIEAGTNTTTCPIPPYVNLTSTNTYGTTGYIAKYTPIPFYGTPGDGTPYYFNVPATTGLQPLGSVPEGTYAVEIYRTSAPLQAIFKGGCNKPVITGTSAIFYNVNVTTCNSISITPEN